MKSKNDLTIYEVQKLIEGKNIKEAGKILSGNEAGKWCGIWFDWFSVNESLPNKASRFVTFLKGLKGEWTKTHYVWLKENCPFVGSLYRDIRLSPNEGEHHNIGYSLGNGTTRERLVFDTREDKRSIREFHVTSNKMAIDYVNAIMNRKTLNDLLQELGNKVNSDSIISIIDFKDSDVLSRGKDYGKNGGEFVVENLLRLFVVEHGFYEDNHLWVKVLFHKERLLS